MAEPPRPAGETDLERMLADLGSRLDYPATPDISGAVRTRLHDGHVRPPRQAPRLLGYRPRAALAATLLLVLLGVTVLALPGSRSAIADRLGLRGAEIHMTPTATLPPTPAIPDLGLGRAVTLDEARNAAGFDPFLPPAALSNGPDGIYYVEPPAGGQISYVYAPRDGLPEAAGSGVGMLVSQFEGDTNESFIQKQLEPGTTLEVVTVAGNTGFWLSGKPHIFYYADEGGDIHQETIRLAGNVLIWEVDGLTLRIESSLPRDDVIRIAESMTR